MTTDSSFQAMPTDIPFGQRLKILRTARGMSQDTLAGLVGKSGAWVRGLEVGRLQQPKLPVILRLAEALRLRDIAQLTGGQSMRIDLFTGPGHTRLPAVRAAINALPVGGSDRRAPRPEHLRARLAAAWAARHHAPNHREVIGALLPDLIGDAQLAVRQAGEAADRRAAQAVLAEVYSLSQFFVAYQPAPELLWRVAERGIAAATESEDPRAIGVAAWLLAQAHRDTNDWDAADAITLDTIDYLEPQLPDAPTQVLAIWGALQFEAGYTAARRGERANAWRYWDVANNAAARLPGTYYDMVTSFSRTIMGAHGTTIAVELRSGPEGVRQASAAEATTIPSHPRRARHRIEQARAFQLDGQPDAALATLDAAFAAAPETIRYNGYARRIVLEEMDARGRRRERAGELAAKIGMLTG